MNGILFKEAFVDDGASEVDIRTFSDVDRAVNCRRDFTVVGVLSSLFLCSGFRVALNLLVALSGLSLFDDVVDVVVVGLLLE